MGNIVSVLENFFEDILETIFNPNSSNSNTNITNSEEILEIIKNLNITNNPNLSKLLEEQNEFNKNSIEDEQEINLQLSNINLNDNYIKSNNELLQLLANKYNDKYNKNLELREKIYRSARIIQNKNKKLKVRSLIINFFKSLILIAFFISVPSLLYSLGYINENKFLILITICIIFLIIYFMFRKKSNRELQIINNDNELYKAKKIKDFKFKNKYSSYSDLINNLFTDNLSEEYSTINSELIDKCCNSNNSDDEDYTSVEISDLLEDDNCFYYDKTLPTKIYE
jgi:hypothetical protein